jgi:hypothetical protein
MKAASINDSFQTSLFATLMDLHLDASYVLSRVKK